MSTQSDLKKKSSEDLTEELHELQEKAKKLEAEIQLSKGQALKHIDEALKVARS